MARRAWRVPALMLAVAGLLLACGGGDGDSDGDDAVIAYGVTPDNQLVHFDVTSPNEVTSVAITGLGAGKAMRAIDFRVSDGVLFGLGSDGVIYTINKASGAATPFGDTVTAVLSGSTFGFDWSAPTNRFRVVTDQDSSRRVNGEDGTLAATDTPVSYNVGDVNNGDNPAIVGVALSNNSDTATSASLFAIDQDNDALVLVAPPNAGILVTIGPLGVNVAGDIGFDIAPGGTAYAALVLQGNSTPSLYTVDLATGAATLVGPINSQRLTGLSIQP